MTQKPFLTRKELSGKTGISIKVLRLNEKSLGIADPKCKLVVNSRVILYRAQEAFKNLGISQEKERGC